ncbi:PTS sugar transporter subunit IIB [Aerococcus sanguinicola]|uniref:PTS mannose/fructose/sorbose transporter subunit IIB n=1 Tax=Aerococcus sanguinicola TaxID=119206 RepID=A0A2I1MQ75_9LACT|nr:MULTISPECIES: PTS sugar transporter subunit IIB [Aerococcus]MDK7050108.1 PTS sugar transporter subunit IIB [Aerococcus sanguinicola]OFT93306.1 PTS sugar transporter [Aerococcus sp. HMSC23C02]PKZ22290.1 PTS mannose/fructose/sorbose transporter subunit IIB [Aerococcus sanguinicola]
MIKLCRVDHRLLHGQVAMAWTSFLGANCYLIANDKVANDEVWKNTLRLAKPSNAKLVMKTIDDAIDALNSGVTDKYQLIILVESVKDAKKLADQVPDIKAINLGGQKFEEGRTQIGKAFFISTEDESALKKLAKRGLELDLRQVPSESKHDIGKEMLNK